MPHLLAAAAVLLTFVAGATAAAQDATPAPYPVAPEPAECRVAPRSLDEVAAVVGTPTADSALPAASPAAVAVPPGEPADAETAARAEATLRELFACTNGGDFLRVYALFTDDFLRAFFAGTPLTDDVLAFLGAAPQPLPDDQRRIIVRIGIAQRLADGRLGVPIVLDEPDDPRSEEPDYAILADDGGRWLVDEIREDAAADGRLDGSPIATP